MEKTSEPHWRSFALALGTRVRRLRAMRGLTQQELAEASGLSRNTISMWERNETNRKGASDPTLSNVYAVARALDVPPAVLIPDATHTPGPRSTDSGVLDIDMRWPAAQGDTLTFRERELLGVREARGARGVRTKRDGREGRGLRDSRADRGSRETPGTAGNTRARETRESRRARGVRGVRGRAGVKRPGRFPRPGGRGVPGTDGSGSNRPGTDGSGSNRPGRDEPGRDE
ncbi:helix-turn-helix transcriptional regulator [Corynebacterium frankenforstense]|uniref:helix-turn-helix transcriptional regulator n=1 Tax=Corynebacterium frankenforstense TaxID=1230998 RepID=UPI001474F2B8|nr:helix-turn-helix transcriptional regulator [Corynebacterium frankenforstense]